MKYLLVEFNGRPNKVVERSKSYTARDVYNLYKTQGCKTVLEVHQDVFFRYVESKSQ